MLLTILIVFFISIILYKILFYIGTSFHIIEGLENSYKEYEGNDPMILAQQNAGNIEYLKSRVEELSSVKNDVKYVLKQFRIYKLSNYNYCILQAKLSKKAIKYLKSVSKIGSTINANGVITQKEIAGRLIIGKVRKDLVYELDVDHTSIMYGEEEQVDLISGLYNFHSHPQEAYDRHNQTIGWPSAQDYVVFFESSLIYDTLIHIVASVEGFYVLSLSKFWFNNKNVSDIQKQVKKFIIDNYNKCSQKDNTIDWYISTINGITYEGFQLFQVQYVSWNDADTIFTFSYKKNGVNCIARQSTLDIIKNNK